MKTEFRSPVLAVAAAMMLPTVAQATSASLLPFGRDAAICDPIFARLQARDTHRTLMAQATPAETGTPQPADATRATPAAPGNAGGNAAADAGGGETDEDALANQLKDMLQACSYDGKALTVDARALAASPEPDGVAAVDRVMRFTGLPQNFRIMETDVPNAAAIIVLGPDGIPQRVIAYNRAFMQQVRTATDNDDWSPVSIMAHEIGHHLSGHTLVPGGSQPPIELEADKFSGYVLFKMGARLEDAQKAIATLIPEAASPTHPGRRMRLGAIRAGWMQSCGQQQDGCGETAVVSVMDNDARDRAATQRTATGVPAPSGSGPSVPGPAVDKPAAAGPSGTGPSATAPSPTGPSVTGPSASSSPVPPRPSPVPSVKVPSIAANGLSRPPMPDIPGAADIVMPSLSANGGSKRPAPVAAATDRLPRLDAAETPSKFDRFVYDTVGVFDVGTKEKLSRLAYQYAAATDVEIVTIVTDDLQDRSADQYALDVMRQMRVGKMDVGNGAVFVVAPGSSQAGVALGPGLLVRYDTVEPLRTYLKSFLTLNDTPRKSLTSGQLIADASYRVMRDTQALEWSVRFNSLQQMLTTARTAREDRERSQTPYNPATDPTWRKLLRIDATVVSTSPDMADPALDINEPKTRHVGPALHVRTAGGQDAVLYVNRNVTALMPVPLENGKRYAFIARDSFLAADAPQFDLISYDRLD